MAHDAVEAARADLASHASSSVDSSLAARTFAGKGEMARLMRETDWSKTPLGPIESWPQSLRTAVSICLGSRHPIVLWWGPARWMFYNDAYRPMLGESKHPQFLGRPGQECWEEIWDVIGPMMDQVIETGEATWSEDLFLLMLRSGYPEETYFTFSYSPIRDDAGRPSGIFNACTESTARVLDRRRLKTMREMAVEARTASEAARLCVEILGRNARDIPFALVYLFDAAGQRLHLAGHAGLEAGSAASPSAVDVADRDAAGWPLARVADHGAETVEDLALRFEDLPVEPWGEAAHQARLLPIARAGALRPAGVLVLGISPRLAFDDDYRGFFDLVVGHVSTAVSNARAFEEERERAEKLAELDRVKTTFFSNVSHEFRTPLTLMLGPLEEGLADTAEPLGPRQTPRLKLAHDNALRLLKLVNALLDFSRLEAGRMRAHYAPLDISTFTAELAGMFQSAVDKAGLRLVVECAPLSEPAWVDRDMWERIVPNLVSNAFKFTLAGQVAVRVSEEGSRFVLEVADTGVGIPESELPRIFDRFHRVAGAVGRTYEGTGIGLSLVRELVELHGGRIAVDSAVGRGTTFRVGIPKGFEHLPAEAVSSRPVDPHASRDATAHAAEAARWSGASSAETTAPASATPGTGSTRPPILVVDDNRDLREYIAELLSPTYEVSTATDGAAALEAVRARPPALVVSDVMMPRLDGIGLVRALRAEPSTASLPVILLSARAGEDSAVEGLDAGADDYLAKPFSARELLARVRTHVELARARRAWVEELERANRELDAFSYSVSHDLRAPLRAIDGFTRALAEDYAATLDERGQEYVRRVCRNVERMGGLIDDLLGLARISRAPVSQNVVDLSALAAGVVADLRAAHPDRVVRVDVAGGLLARGDRRLLNVVLVNLIGNAWKFTARSADARIELGRQPADEPTFFVRDNGAGFDTQYAGRLFAPFQRLHTAKEFQGTGVGLATVQRVMSRHGGRVWADAVVGQGATFFFSLPSKSGARTALAE